MQASFSATRSQWIWPQGSKRLRKRQQILPRLAASDEKDLEVEDQGKASEQDKATAKQSGNEIYIGFDKSDSAPRSGRKGRVVSDDPSKYPDRNEFVGGWAGGEVGLKEFVKEEEAKKDSSKSYQKAKVIESDPTKSDKKKAVTEDGEVIYLGFSKDELEVRKSGAKGRSIRDDPRRYPDKENVGVFPGLTGGFAGGEKGVKQFVESGDIKFSDGGKREFSPVLLAGLVAFGVTTGAILLNSGVLLSEQALGGQPQSQAGGSPLASSSLSNALTNSLVIDEKTRLLLNAALVFLGLGALLIGSRAVLKQVQERSIRLKDDAVNIGKASVFWLAVLLAALYIVDYQ